MNCEMYYPKDTKRPFLCIPTLQHCSKYTAISARMVRPPGSRECHTSRAWFPGGAGIHAIRQLHHIRFLVSTQLFKPLTFAL